ncbi:MAG: peptidase M23 family protein [Parcubacteria group bacterium Greene0416_79]|nr:MAG: peptidase M23 family protein [Parcubacteria group bacterium Greene0416_79]
MKQKAGYKAAWFLLSVFFVSSLLPLYAHAGVFSFVADLFFNKPKEETAAVFMTSQNVPVLAAAQNPDPNPAKGGGDITIVGGSALLPETGPVGTLADIEENHAGTISIYVVREGDTLSAIAKMFQVTVNTIVWANDLRSGLIQPGQTLIILPISGVRHIAAKGDTFASIAKRYKADLNEIFQYNGLEAGAALATGDIVIVPDGEIAPVSLDTRTVRVRGAGGPDYAGYYLRPILGGRKTQGLHGYNGLDFSAYLGAPVFASAFGIVIIARDFGWNGGYGKYLVIAHANGTQTLYGHLSAVSAYAGQNVVRGEIIGYVGNTGRSTGPHLHFEVRGARNPF